MPKPPVIIVGAGLFGSIAAKVAHSLGRRVVVVDAGLPNAGSRPAACLIRPSWISGLGAAGELGMKTLREHYRVHDLTFKLRPAGSAQVQWVDPQDIWRRRDASTEAGHVVRGSARLVGNGEVVVDRGIGHDRLRLRGDVLVAAGVWSFSSIGLNVDQQLTLPKMKALAGAAFTFSGELPKPLISVWAPYKQVVAFTREPGRTWCGDGAAILERNWDDARMGESQRRCQKLVGRRQLLLTQFGLRPYVEGHKEGYFFRIAKNTWVSTGGAKNGTVIAAAQAAQFVEEL